MGFLSIDIGSVRLVGHCTRRQAIEESSMNSVINNGLAVIAVGLACARACEELINLRRRHQGATTQTLPPRTSLLNPAAGFAALAYGHSINADPALLLAAWLHTLTVSACVLIEAFCDRRESGRVLLGLGENTHE